MAGTVDSRKRWDTDDRFTGVADASAFAAAVEELAGLARRPGWIAEPAASVRERTDGDGVIFEVVTGIPDGGRFASHGHTVRLTLRPAGSP